MSLRDEVIAYCYGNDPLTLASLLRAIASGEAAQIDRHDTILISAAEMIEEFDRRTGELG